MKTTRTMMLALGVAAAACGGSDDPADPDAGAPAPDAVATACEYGEYDHGLDGLYGGYAACSEAHFPDFTHPTARWDGFYPDRCAGQTGLHAFACMEQLFWQVFQFDYADRLEAYAALKELVASVEDDPSFTTEQRARLHWRLGQLGVAIIAENGDFSPGPEIQAFLQQAHEIDPDNTIIEAWLMTIEINFIVQFGGDLDEALDRLWQLYLADPPGVAGTVMGVAAGMPLDSGWPGIAAQLVSEIVEADCSVWCGWEFLRAPYAMEGQYFSYAEVFARVGMRDETLYWLEKSAAGPRAATWPFKAELELALDDVDGFMGKFAERGESEMVTDLLLSGSTGACTMCHDHLR